MTKHKHKTSDILKAAKPFLWDGVNDLRVKDLRVKEPFICFAVECTKYPASAKRRVTRMIESRLGVDRWQVNHTLRSWLAVQLKCDTYALESKDVQRHRLQWMDKLIAEFKAKGD